MILSKRAVGPARTILLAGLVSLTLIGSGGVAFADDDPTTPPETSETQPAPGDPAPPNEEAPPAENPPAENPPAENPPAEDPPAQDPPAEDPKPVPAKLNVGSGCDKGTGFVEANVTNPNDTEGEFTVSLLPASGSPLQTKTVKIAAGESATVDFGDVAGGEFTVRAKLAGTDLVSDETITVDRCKEVGPVDDPLQVFVRCQDGEGVVTIRVFNTKGDSRTFTVSIDDLELPGEIELGKGEYAVVVDEVPAPDGTFVVKVKAEGIDHAETVTVACAPATTPPTTTPPAPQPRPAPATGGGGLASTGAAVGGIVLLGLLAFGLGAGLLIMSRRRRVGRAKGTQA